MMNFTRNHPLQALLAATILGFALRSVGAELVNLLLTLSIMGAFAVLCAYGLAHLVGGKEAGEKLTGTLKRSTGPLIARIKDSVKAAL